MFRALSASPAHACCAMRCDNGFGLRKRTGFASPPFCGATSYATANLLRQCSRAGQAVVAAQFHRSQSKVKVKMWSANNEIRTIIQFQRENKQTRRNANLNAIRFFLLTFIIILLRSINGMFREVEKAPIDANNSIIWSLTW